MDEQAIIEFFIRIIKTEDSANIDKAIFNAESSKKLQIVVPYLCQLLEATWHFSHENITSTLQQVGDPRSVNVLFETATRKFDYLNYDDSYPLSRKCTWALADIGTKEAKDALTKISSNSNKEIAGYAEKRIKNWNSELDRKKHSS